MFPNFRFLQTNNIPKKDELRSNTFNSGYLWIIQKMQPPEKCQNKCKKYGQIH